LSDQAALGGLPGPSNDVDASRGGNGAAGTTLKGETSPVEDVSGGGGGAAGRIRINSGTANLKGKLSPGTSTSAASTGALLTRPLN
jgi:hypothetical protein